MIRRAAVHLDTTEQISFKSLDLLAAAATAVPLQILSALDSRHRLYRQLTKDLARYIFHRGRTAACLAREILFFQCFSRGISVRTLLIEAVANLRVEKPVRRDLDRVPAITAAQPDHLAIKSFRRLLDRDQMTETLILNVLDFSPAILDFLVSDYSRHTTKNNPFVLVLSGFSPNIHLF